MDFQEANNDQSNIEIEMKKYYSQFSAHDYQILLWTTFMVTQTRRKGEDKEDSLSPSWNFLGGPKCAENFFEKPM